MILTKEQKKVVLDDLSHHATLCCRDWKHQVASAAAMIYRGKSEVKKLAAQQAVLFFLTMEGEFAVFTNEDTRRIRASVRELVRRDASLRPLLLDLAGDIS